MAGRDLAANEYHRAVCSVMTRLEYALATSKLDEGDQLAATLLVRLLAGIISSQDESLMRLEEAASVADPMELRTGRKDAGGGALDETFRQFLELLPQPLNEAESQVANIVAPFFLDRVSTPAITFAFERFRGNNHIVSDERLRPIGDAIL